MVSQSSVIRWATSAAAVALWSPALIILLGFTKTEAKHSSLGLETSSAMPPPVELAVEGMSLMILPVFAIAAIYLMLWIVWCVDNRTIKPEIPLNQLPLLSIVAVASLLSMANALMDIGEGTRVLIPGIQFTAFDAIVLAIMATLAVLLLSLSFAKGIIARLIAGNSFSAVIFAFLIIIGALLGMAGLVGADEGNDIAWGCVGSPGVQLEGEIPGMDNNTTYILITHAGGFYYVRDPALNGGTREAIAVPETLVHRAVHSYVGASRDC